MQQGDQYALPIQIKNSDGVIISPDNCCDVKIQVGDLDEKSWRAGEIYPQFPSSIRIVSPRFSLFSRRLSWLT